MKKGEALGILSQPSSHVNAANLFHSHAAQVVPHW